MGEFTVKQSNTQLQVTLRNMSLNNPIIPASGTFGYGKIMKEFIDINSLGAILTKSVTLAPREGNPQPRIFETSAGIMNSVGLQNKGIQWFEEEVIPFIAQVDSKKWISISGFTEEDFEVLAQRANKYPIDCIEVNVSCPNIHKEGKQFCQDMAVLQRTLKKVRSASKHSLIAKIAIETNPLHTAVKIISDEGFDGVCIGNTVRGIAIDIEKQKPFFHNIFAGLSGPAIKPIALRAVWEAFEYCPSLPIIGCGGIQRFEDVVEFILAGASATEIGTINLIDPISLKRIIEDLSSYCSTKNLQLSSLIGKAHN